jgi:UDP-N-acetyl-2-amino-2-deoxyglucuronate dehydrogenase
MKNFALIGAAGYVAPKHMKAIKETGHNLVAALDKNDSVGVIDSYFPNASFFTEYERFDRHIEKLRREGKGVDYLSVCTPNYLHDAHIRFGLRAGANVICEKPLVLRPWNLDALAEIEKESDGKINNILQLRLHPNIIALKKKIEEGPKDKIYDIDLTYQTSRGNWYYTSWKGNENKSGGIAMNIGVHFFDMLAWIFGEPLENIVNVYTHDRAAGFLHFKQAKVKWFLSINYNTLSQEIKSKGIRTFRSLLIDGEEVDFTAGFENLHTKSYQAILNGDGFSIMEVKKAIEIVETIRNAKAIGLEGEFHKLAKLPLDKHPFITH